ncbi:hypothetical protein LZL87_010932 [Fusarium oxysporum]|nr:hypothetical protein LZL87_010932 [Fusarium oxysporum]
MNPPNPTGFIESLNSKQTIQGPSPEEWEEMKEAIYEIYITQGQSLKVLVSEMKTRRGFDATLHQTGQLHNNFALLEYFLDLLRILAHQRYPSGHPIPNLLKVLRQTPPEERVETLRVGYLRTIRCLESRVGFGNAVVLSMWSKYFKRFGSQELPASALTCRYESVLQEAQNSFTTTGTRAIEILHGYIYAAYYNANDAMLTWNLASIMVDRALSAGLDQPEWCLATQGYAMAAKLLYAVSEQTGHGNQGKAIL